MKINRSAGLLFVLFLFVPLMLGACAKGTDGGGTPIDNPTDNPDPKDPPAETGTIKVMSYNIQHGAPYGDKDKVNLNDIAQVINHEKPDLVALQEVDKYTTRASMDQARELGRLTDMNYYFFKAIDYQGGDYGVAVLSRYPIISQEGFTLPMPEKGEQRVLAVVTIKITDDLQIDFGSTHLELNAANRLAQAKEINRISDESTHPLIIAGDLNATPDEEPIKILKEKFQSYCSSDCPYTYPSRNPQKAIDYIMMNGKAADIFKIDHYRVVTGTEASDHLPIVQTISLK